MSSRSCISSTAAGCWPEHLRRGLSLLLALGWLTLAHAAAERGTALLTFTNFTHFPRTATAEEVVLTSPEGLIFRIVWFPESAT